jgi:prevent-host-death family protein
MRPARQVNVHEAKTQLSKLLLEVEHGREVIVARDGTPVAKLVPFPTAEKARRLGQGAGEIWIAPDFDAPLSPDDMKRWGF